MFKTFYKLIKSTYILNFLNILFIILIRTLLIKNFNNIL